MVRAVSVMVAMVPGLHEESMGTGEGSAEEQSLVAERPGRLADSPPRAEGVLARGSTAQLAAQPSPDRASVAASRPSVSGSSRTISRSVPSAGPTRRGIVRRGSPMTGASSKAEPGASSRRQLLAGPIELDRAQPTASARARFVPAGPITRRAACPGPARRSARTRAARTGRSRAGCRRRRPGAPTRCRHRWRPRRRWP